MANNVVISMRPPKFSGTKDDDAISHWLAFLDYVEENNIDNNAKVSKFRITLSGEPRQWFEDNKETLNTLDLLEKGFKAEYGPQTTQSQYADQLQNMKMLPEETLPAYKKRVARIATKAGLQAHTGLQISAFLKGLPASIQDHVRSKRDDSLDEVLKTAQAMMVTIPSSTEVTAPAVYAVQATPSRRQVSNSDVDNLANNVQRMMYNERQPRPRNRSTSRDRRPRSQSYSQSRSRSRGRRYNRDQTPRKYPYNPKYNQKDRSQDRYRSHGSKDRKVSFRSKSRSPSPGPCYYCSKHGHTADFCKVLKKHLREGKLKSKDFQ